jgi:hypothetical protein
VSAGTASATDDLLMVETFISEAREAVDEIHRRRQRLHRMMNRIRQQLRSDLPRREKRPLRRQLKALRHQDGEDARLLAENQAHLLALTQAISEFENPAPLTERFVLCSDGRSV